MTKYVIPWKRKNLPDRQILSFASLQWRVVVVLAIVFVFSITPAHAASVAERTSGRILLDVSNNGEAWYVYPKTLKRYFLGRPSDAFNIMRFLGLGITNENLAKIPTESSTSEGDLALRQRVSGRILLQVEENGEAWYVYPGNLKRYYLGRPTDAFGIMSSLGLGITAQDLGTIGISTDFSLFAGETESYKEFALTLTRGAFSVRVVTLDRNSYEMITDTAEAADCGGGCGAQSLQAYAQENNATMGIHGTYFCPPDYASCADKINTFLWPVHNTALGVMLEEDRLPFHNGPMVTSGTDRVLRYYHRTRDFGNTVQEFEQENATRLQAAIANYPSLVENGAVVVESEPIEDGQRVRASRGAIGFSDRYVYLVLAPSATVIDLAYILQALGATSAMNLDGGGSSALYYQGSYKAGPGRQLPNAILFRRR